MRELTTNIWQIQEILLHRLPGPLRYEETLSGHYLIRPDDAGWPHVEEAVLQFSRTFYQDSNAG